MIFVIVDAMIGSVVIVQALYSGVLVINADDPVVYMFRMGGGGVALLTLVAVTLSLWWLWWLLLLVGGFEVVRRRG